jgi:hypothetical protein
MSWNRLGLLLPVAIVSLALPSCPTYSQSGGAGFDSSSARKLQNYFPPGTINIDVEFFSSYLKHIDEPALFDLARDPKVVLYRLESVTSHARLFAVRLVPNVDGSAQLLITDSPASLKGAFRKSQINIAVTDVDRFRQMVEKANFWSMPSNEPPGPNNVYKTDPDTFVFEGVRNGGYHVVLRMSPDPGHFLDMIKFLAQNLAGIKGI